MASLLSFVRNLLIARLIPVADYGIAATFAVAMAIVEMASAFGLQQQIVQSRKGNDPTFQANLQGFQLLRGVISAVVLVALAGPLAQFLGVPEVAWAYRVLALIPLLNALQHFDIHRLTREMRFKALLFTGTVPMLLSLLTVWPLYVAYGDWQVMLWALVVQAAIAPVVSHIFAERIWRISLSRAAMRETLRFGWPLLVNSILLFLIFQGDKLIVGRLLGMETLAIFAMGMTLTLTPSIIMDKSVQNLFLPQLSKVDRDTAEGRARFQHLATVLLQVSLINGAVLCVVVSLFGAPLVQVFLGEKYAALSLLLIPMAALQAVRVAKTGASIIALSSGHTANALQANLLRVATLPLVLLALSQGADLRAVIYIGVGGELLGYALSQYLVRRKTQVSLRPMIMPTLFMGSIFALSLVPNITSFYSPLLLPAGATIILILGLVSMKDLRLYVKQRQKSA